VGTPPEFLRAVEGRFGPITFDLAADESNHVVAGWFGPGGIYPDALATAWCDIEGLLWLNPPYDNIKAFAHKAKIESAKGARVAMLIPASVATNWFAEEIDGHAFVLPIRPRLTFVGHTSPYPKDLMLCVFGPGAKGFECWRWKP
jgi:phage N-6-adenine-methyltransferase